MSAENNKQKIKAIKKLIADYCDANLHKMYKAYILNLWLAASRNKSLNMSKGKNEIWAASLIHAIARLNFLSDHKNPDEHHVTLDALCDYFQTKKSTIGNKATLIIKNCNIRTGQPEYCRSDITDMTTFYKTQDGLIIDKNTARKMFGKEIVVETASEEESAEIERFMAERKRLEEEKLQQKKERRLEINRMIAEKKKAKKIEWDKKQLRLFDI
ncbi:hypothetical protein MHK_004735 [Candidatus Magnetomorum sp. HK-1]|nr:hypothetical protein MHK_004735 [Candidatus Magnetomorum sp. HK-1]